MKSAYLTQKEFDQAETVQSVGIQCIKHARINGEVVRAQVAGWYNVESLSPDQAAAFLVYAKEPVVLIETESPFPRSLFYNGSWPIAKFGGYKMTGCGAFCEIFPAKYLDLIVRQLKKNNFTQK